MRRKLHLRDWLTKFYPLLAVAGLAVLLVVLACAQHHRKYVFSNAEAQLLAAPSVDTSKIQQTAKGISFNKQSAEKGGRLSATVAAPLDSTGEVPYKADLPASGNQAISFGDSANQLSFKMIPLQASGGAKREGGHVIYPLSTMQRKVYTFKRNGIKEDIIIKQPAGDSLQYSWKLQLGDKLSARMMADGSVGIYSASSYLTGDVTAGDPASQALLNKARKNATKDNLTFVLPAPYIKDATGIRDIHDAAFTLKGNILTLTAHNLKARQYPLSIDPSIVVTTTADFLGGNDDGMIDYSTTDEISRANTAAGPLGTLTTQASGFTNARYAHTSVVYNGYIYIIGGGNASNGNGCDINGSCNDVQYAWLDPSTGAACLPSNHATCTGTVFAQQTSAFTTTRAYHTSVVYNGYVYIVGGLSGAGVAQSDVQYAWLDPSTGAACLPSNHATCTGTVFAQQTSAFSARYGHTSVVYNGYIYVVGGKDGSGTAQNDIQYAAINSDGSLSCPAGTTCSGGAVFAQQTGAFATARAYHASVAYNGFLYVIGGKDNGGTLYRDIQYCPLNADGSVGACTDQATALSSTVYGLTAVAYNGILYLAGGVDNFGNQSNTETYCPLNADGSVGACASQTKITGARSFQSSVAYNGYLYVVGGWGGSSTTYNDIQRTVITLAGTPGPTPAQSSAFTVARVSHTSVVANGYVYIIGGYDANTSLTDQNDVQYAWLDPSTGAACLPSNHATCTGTVFAQQTSAFSTPRENHTSVVANGYVYIIGGFASGTGLDQNDVQYAWLNPSTGAACLPSNHATCSGTVFAQQTSAFTLARDSHTSVVANGYVYIIGGYTGTDQNDVQYAWLNPSTGAACLPSNHATCSGTVFARQTSAFSTARDNHSSVVYNGYVYIIGGTNGTVQSDIQYAWLNPSTGAACLPSNHATCTGTVFAQQTSAALARASHTSVVSPPSTYI